MRYFDKPPLLYGLISGAFAVFGPGEAAARLGSALPAIGVAVATAWIGIRLGGPRVGLVAGLVVVANLENGLISNLAFGASFPEARDIFWDAARLETVWTAGGRVFLITAVRANASVIRGLPPGSVHLLQEGGGRRLYSNRP